MTLPNHELPLPPKPPQKPPAPTTQGKDSLYTGTWFKLICGASTHDVPTVRNLCEVYTVAGADCIDVAADAAVITAAREGIARALTRVDETPMAPIGQVQKPATTPLLMASVSDGEDVHFRKAYFNPSACPMDCPRPCERACPAEAINTSGVIAARCYGCGRCIPVCPLGIVEARESVYDIPHIRSAMLLSDALEIHTAKNRIPAFQKLWHGIDDIVTDMKVVAVSLPDLGSDDELQTALRAMWETMRDAVEQSDVELIWQTDGRPMSGDMGGGTAKAAVALAGRVRHALTQAGIAGHVQLAGGTNWKTVPLMQQAGLLRMADSNAGETAAGVAMGGYARKIVKEELGNDGGFGERMTDASFERAVNVAVPLVQAIKCR